MTPIVMRTSMSVKAVLVPEVGVVGGEVGQDREGAVELERPGRAGFRIIHARIQRSAALRARPPRASEFAAALGARTPRQPQAGASGSRHRTNSTRENTVSVPTVAHSVQRRVAS
ncbi:MAG TPA: hypothetical protein VNN12_08935, partial [Dehalococcoidia bacterium]|nr:hypothetical protein [Dehalococcoidia bacterium]